MRNLSVLLRYGLSDIYKNKQNNHTLNLKLLFIQ